MNEVEQWQFDRINGDRMAYYRQTYDGSLRLLSGSTNLKEKHLLVYCEQGVGDIIQMLRYVPALLAGGCSLTMHCPQAMHRLIQSQWDVGVLEKSDPNLPDHDMHILSMDLPILLELANSPYIHIDDVVECWKGSTGIAWTGNPDHPDNLVRSCPLGYFQNLPGQLVCLQQSINWTGDVACQMTLEHQTQKDLYDAAVLVNTVDTVVTVDTSLLHLAGAMGKRTYALLAKNCDPRWGNTLTSTPWYPSIKLIRQRKEGDWGSVFEQLMNECGTAEL